MADDAGQEREWITGVIGEPFQLDDDGKIFREPSEAPSETPNVSDILDAFEEGKWANPPALDTPTESFPDWSDAVPTGIIPDSSDDIGVVAGSIPADAETSI